MEQNIAFESIDSEFSVNYRATFQPNFLEWSERIEFGSRDSERAAKFKAKLTLADRSSPIKVSVNFLITSSFRIAESE